MSKSPNPDIIDKIYFRNIYSCQRKIYWYKVKVMETINAVWEHSYGEDCIPNFSANMEQPRHRWYEFKEGFSLTLVERAIRETKKDNKSTSFTVLDPFSGSGTSPLTALQSRCNAIGYEVNPFMSFVGKTKCQQRTKSIHDYTKELNRILVQRPFRLKSPLEGVSTFTGSGENGKWLFNLDVLRAYEALYQHISLSEYKDFFLLALITSAMQCCNAKKDGKCLRYLKNWKALNYTGANLRDTFKANALQMISDLERSPLLEGTRDITQGDTRKLLQASEHDSADLIIFSPPYLNSFDYSDIYRPELFLGKFVKDNSELMQLRKQTLRSHVQCKWDRKDSSTSPWVTGIVQKLTAKQDTLWNANIPQMVSSYFYDMEEVLKQSYRIAKQNSQLWFVVSTSAYSGVEIPVDLVSVTDDGRKMFKFILQIDDTNRDNEFELSESQRFFIDIALRMAIVTFVCSKTTASTSMLIDTPEGSLDIAYETNAGSMFYEYIAANQKMIITANLNSSGLIQTLAGKTKFEKFELISMLKWAKLSSVQNTHFELFERSISTIESKLEG